MRISILLLIFAALQGICQTQIDLHSSSKNPPIRISLTLPATCTKNTILVLNESPTSTVKFCSSTNNWTDIGSDGGAATWGSITGTLTNQTDLASALSGKSSTGHTHAYSALTDIPISFTPSAHASSHTVAGGDPLTLGQAQITDLITTLSGKSDTTHLHAGVYEPADAAIQAAVADSHDQNTDTSTSSNTFQLGTAGPIIKNTSGVFELLNATQTARTGLKLLYVDTDDGSTARKDTWRTGSAPAGDPDADTLWEYYLTTGLKMAETSAGTVYPFVFGPTSAPTDAHIALFDGTTGAKIKTAGKGVPSGDIVGTSDTQTLTAKTLTTPVVGSYTVSGLPAAGTAGRIAVVTDGNGPSCTSGSGSTLVLCRDSGSAWAPVGGTSGSTVGTIWAGSVGGNTVSANTTTYAAPFSGSFSTTEANRQWMATTSCTARNLYFRTSSTQSGSADLVVTVRKNGEDTTITATVAAGQGANTWYDTTHTASVVAGDRLSVKFVEGNATSAGIYELSLQCN